MAPALAGLLLLCAGRLAIGQSARLQSADTAIYVQARASSPRVLRLQATGQAGWTNRASEQLIEFVEVGAQRFPLQWKLNHGASLLENSRRVVFVYETSSPRLRLTWEWRVRAAYGPIEHQIRIQNLDSRELWLPLQDSFCFDWEVDPQVALEHLYIEKGADAPSPTGTHQVMLPSGYAWEGTSSTYARPSEGEAREIIPWFLVQLADHTQSGWYVGIEFSGRTRLSVERNGDSLLGTVGLNPAPGPFRTRLGPGQSFETPAIFIGGFSGGSDTAGNMLRRWVRQVLTNPLVWSNPNYPLMVNNSWGNGMEISEVVAHRMIRDSAELGLDMFHVDAGWFRGVGDWYPNPQKFPHGVAAVADDAHRHGLRFGLWVDWTQAGLDLTPGALNAHDPLIRDWLVTDLPADWAPEPFKGQTIDLGLPAAQAWAQREVSRIVGDYHLDMLEHDGYLVAQGCIRKDHPHAPPDESNTKIHKAWGSYWVDSSNSTDVSYHAVHAYYEIYSKLRKQHPGLLLEACNDGGRMIDFGSAAHVDYFSITDTYDPLSNRRAFYDASHVLPPAMLETYVERWPTPDLSHFRYMLRSGMMGWLTIMIDTTSWSAEQHLAAKAEIQMYKNTLRPLIRDADLYHISARPDGVHWDAIEYFDPKTGKGAVYAFRGSTPTETSHSFVLKGLEPDGKYRLRFHDHSSPDCIVSGRELLSLGLNLKLVKPSSSEVILFENIGK